ncbi:MAG: type VI secretion system protein TssA [Gammaproteobacteria bacterium]
MGLVSHMFVVKQLLNPINSVQPCGEDLSFSSDLDAIAEARRFDDSTLDQGEWETELKEADWGFVVERCAKLIGSKSKDLRLAVWLTEANAKINHFAGLGDGYLLLAGLCDQFWDGLYPLPDEEGQEQRIGNLNWLLSRSARLVREIPITEGKGTAFSTNDFDTARTRSTSAEKAAAEHGRPEVAPKLGELDAARRKSSRAFFEKLLADSQHCQRALNQLEKSVDERLGIDGPGFSAAKESLDGVIRTLSRFAQDAGVHKQALSTNDSTQNAEDNNNLPSSTPVTGTIQTRAQALEQLRIVADFFRRTEPHSPVAYLADKAAAWGDMSLHSWLNTVIKDPTSLAHVEELLGLQTPSSSEK